MATIYIVEYYSLRNNPRAWRPLPNQLFFHEKEAQAAKDAWLKGSPPDIEFEVFKYERAQG